MPWWRWDVNVRISQQAGTEEPSLGMLEQGIIIALEKESEFTNCNNRHGVR